MAGKTKDVKKYLRYSVDSEQVFGLFNAAKKTNKIGIIYLCNCWFCYLVKITL